MKTQWRELRYQHYYLVANGGLVIGLVEQCSTTSRAFLVKKSGDYVCVGEYSTTEYAKRAVEKKVKK